MFAVLYQTGKQISIPSWDLQYHVSSVSSFKGAFLIEAKQLVFCEVIFVYFWNYFHANVWQNVKDLTPYFDRHIY